MLEGNPARIHRAEDARAKQTRRMNDPDDYEESPKHASTYKVTQDILG